MQLDQPRPTRLLRWLAAASLIVCAAAVVSGGATARPQAASARVSIVPVAASRVGRAVRVRVGIQGWRSGLRWRIYVDGRYNNYSTDPKSGLAVAVSPGRHRISVDVVAGSTRVGRGARTLTATVAAAGGPVVAAAGDIACDPADPEFAGGRGEPDRCQQAATARIVEMAHPSAVLPVGDTQYQCGGNAAFSRSYAPTWGRFRAISHPVPGNADYGEDKTSRFTPTCSSGSPGASYFGYFGASAGDPSRGYYSFDVGNWHLIALNSECQYAGGCGAGSQQETWLQMDLAASRGHCTLLYWHRPRWATTAPFDNASLGAFWSDAYQAKADVVVSGHAHLYARFAPLDISGKADSVGPAQFIVGTGGRDVPHVTAFRPTVRAAHSGQFGILLLTLHARSYEWQFLPTEGGTYTEHGSAACHS